MSRKGLRRRSGLVLLALALVVGSCSTKTDNSSSSSGSGGKPTKGGALNIGLDAETDGWNPTSSQ